MSVLGQKFSNFCAGISVFLPLWPTKLHFCDHIFTSVLRYRQNCPDNQKVAKFLGVWKAGKHSTEKLRRLLKEILHSSTLVTSTAIKYSPITPSAVYSIQYIFSLLSVLPWSMHSRRPSMLVQRPGITIS